MVFDIENSMVVDSEWDEIEYGIPSRARIKRERKAYEEAEREEYGDERGYSGYYTGKSEGIL